nr:type II secretion system protein [Sterolibacterium sp.]
MIPSAPLPPNPPAQPSHHLAGFTLIEMIVAIVLLGIISVMVATFIRSPVLGYVDTVRRAELTDTAD